MLEPAASPAVEDVVGGSKAVVRELQPAPVIDDSALEIEEGAWCSTGDPRPCMIIPVEGIRRRGSDCGRPKLAQTQGIELTPFPSTQPELVADDWLLYAADDARKPGLLDVELASKSIVPRTIVLPVSSEGSPSQAISTLTPAHKAAQRRWGRIHFAALCWSFFLAGWNDGSTGPLLPTIQRYHNIGFAIVSLLFVISTIGFIAGAIINVYLTGKFGFGKTLVIGSVGQLVAYVLLAIGGPFPLMCIAFGFAGFGQALQITQCNSYVGSLQVDAATKIGILHASYGFGAFSAPLVATHFASQTHWFLYYLISTAIAILNTTILCFAIRFKTADAVRAEAGEPAAEENASASATGSQLKQMMGIPAVHFLSCWALIYVGVEVTLGGWIVTFIQQRRDGGASAGYISSGFFGGLMMGRLVLIWLNQLIGEHRIMFVYAVLAIVLEVTIWLVPSLIGNAIAVSFIGLLLGPMYPILVHHASAILPRWLYAGCVGWISGIGQAGSAVLPFITGILASKFGISSLQPFLVSMMSSMILLWAFVPRVRRID